MTVIPWSGPYTGQISAITTSPHGLDVGAWAFSRECQAECWRVKQAVQLEEVLARLSHPQRLSLIEVVLPKADLPELLRTVTRALESRNGG